MYQRNSMLAALLGASAWGGFGSMPAIKPIPAWNFHPRRGHGRGTGNNRQRMSKAHRRMRNRMARRSRRINRKRAKS